MTSKVSSLTVLKILLIGFVLAFMAGLRVKIDEHIDTISLPQNLEQYLADQKEKFKDIVPGAEKKIVWAEAPGLQTEYAIV